MDTLFVRISSLDIQYSINRLMITYCCMRGHIAKQYNSMYYEDYI